MAFRPQGWKLQQLRHPRMKTWMKTHFLLSFWTAQVPEESSRSRLYWLYCMRLYGWTAEKKDYKLCSSAGEKLRFSWIWDQTNRKISREGKVTGLCLNCAEAGGELGNNKKTLENEAKIGIEKRRNSQSPGLSFRKYCINKI